MRADRAEKAVAAALSSVVLGEELDPVSLLHPSRFLVALGYLQKERYGVVREGWTRRYFVLTPNTLFYYRRNDEATELYTLDDWWVGKAEKMMSGSVLNF